MTAGKRITIEHERLGAIEVPEADVIHFDGLPGFPEARRFALLRHDDRSPFAWLASLDDAALAFAVVDPFELFPDYGPALGAAQLAEVGATAFPEVCLLAIANLGGGSALVNLAAPLLVHAATRRAVQLVLADERWPVRAAIPNPAPDAPPAAADRRPARTKAPSAFALAQTESNPQT
jgi:flagellar assembly factor FliW